MRRFILGLTALLFSLLAPCLADASPLLAIDPRIRPTNSKLIEATTGTVLGYHLVLSNDGASEHLTIWDDVAEKKVTFSVSFFTTIDNARFACQDTKIPNDLFWAVALAVKQYQLCESLPSSITIGKTKVVIVYWNAQVSPTSFLPLDRRPATDQIFTIPLK